MPHNEKTKSETPAGRQQTRPGTAACTQACWPPWRWSWSFCSTWLSAPCPTKYTQYDISTTSLFTLSETTENLLHELNADVTAYYLAESGQEDDNITRLLDRYAGESSYFSWQQRDPVLYPTFAQQYDGASTGSVVLVSGDNSDVLSYNDMYELDLESYYSTGSANYSFQAENAITSGIAKVTRETSYQLYELTGHGEAALSSDFTDTLNNAGVTTAELNLTTAGSIPADAAEVLINAPGADLTDAETTILTDYVANGGKLFVATDFTTDTPNLDTLLAACGHGPPAGSFDRDGHRPLPLWLPSDLPAAHAGQQRNYGG